VQLRSVSVRNIRSYTEGSVEFPPGRTLLVGDVGSGKTSLLQAVEMALFGFAEVSPEHLVRHQERDAEVTLRLEGDGHRYEFRRRFRRRRVRGKESFDTEESSFAVDGHRTKYSATELRQRAIELLGFPDNPSPKAHSDVWRWAVYIPQERMREVLAQRPDERLETVRKALGIENYRTAADNAGELSSDLVRVAERSEAEAEGLRHWETERDEALHTAEEQGGLRRQIEPEAEGTRRALTESEARLRGGETREARASAERQREQQLSSERTLRANELDRVRQEGAGARERAGELLRHATEIEAELAATRPEIGRGESIRARLAELDQSLATVEGDARVLAAAEAGLRSTERNWEEAGRRFARGEADRRAIAVELERSLGEAPLTEPAPPQGPNREEIDRLEEQTRLELVHATASAATLELTEKELNELLAAGECPRCHQRVDPQEFSAHAEESRRAAESARKRSVELEAQRRQLREARLASERFEKLREQWAQLERQRSELRTNLARTDRQLTEAKEGIEGIGREMEGYRERIAALLPRTQEREGLLKARSGALAQLTELEQRGAELARREESARGERVRASQFNGEASRAELRACELSERIAALEGALAPLRASLAGLGSLGEELQQERHRRTRLQETLEAQLQQLAGVRQREESARKRNQEAEQRLEQRRRLLARAAHDRSLSSWIRTEFRSGLLELERRRLSRAQGEFNRLLARYFARLLDDPSLLARCDAAFAPEVEIDGERTPAEALSGGERTALALGFRLAMGAVVREADRLKLDTLILDEPTDGFSPEQVLRLGELLESLEIPQVILVSHERQLAAAADHVVTVSKRDGSSHLEADRSGAMAPEPTEEARASKDRPRRAPRRPPRLTAPETPSPPTVAAPPP
jgi:exonuclease SbcC